MKTLSIVPAALTLLSGMALAQYSDADKALAEVSEAIFTTDSGEQIELGGGATLDGLEAGTLDVTLDVTLPSGVEPNPATLDAFTRFVLPVDDEYLSELPWIQGDTGVSVLGFQPATGQATIALSIPVGGLGASDQLTTHRWPYGASDFEIALGDQSTMKLDDDGTLHGEFGVGSIGVKAEYPPVFVAVDNGVPSSFDVGTVQVLRTDDSADAFYVLQVLDNPELSFPSGQYELIAFTGGSIVVDVPVVAFNADPFQLRLLDLDGNEVWTTDVLQADSSIPVADEHLDLITFDSGAQIVDMVSTTLEEPHGPPIRSKLYADCVHPRIVDHGDTARGDCGACSTATNPPAPNCRKTGGAVFFVHGYCSSNPFSLNYCFEHGTRVVTGPIYKYKGETQTSSGCTQISISIGGAIKAISVGLGFSQPRERRCCVYEKDPLAGNETRTARDCN